MIITVTLNPSIDKYYEVDELLPYQVMRAKIVSNTAGGKGMNVSRVAASAGEEVTAMGFLGGHCGNYFESLVDVSNLNCAFTKVRGETRSCINIHDLATNLSTEVLEPGEPVTAEDLARFLSDFEKYLPLADVVTISGSLPKGVKPVFYSKLICLAKEQGKKIILDSSGLALAAGIGAKPTMIKPNLHEIKQLFLEDISTTEDLIRIGQKLNAKGVEYVVVSLGEGGALMTCPEGVFSGKPPKLKTVNTVGCGDSMVAGFACGFQRGYDAEASLRFAVAISAANALTAKTGSFQEEDLKNLLKEVKIQKL